jgi:CubicO group peptidase (beta-lactamase class C family)
MPSTRNGAVIANSSPTTRSGNQDAAKRASGDRGGTNWNYAHTNYVILGLAMEKITGKPMQQLLAERVLGPLGLHNTSDPGTPAITEPALHAYSSERRYALKIPASVPFTEDVTYWNPSWTITHGAIETTNIDDMHASAVAIGTGRLLKPATFQQMTTKDLIGKTTKVKGCLTCFPQTPAYTYGLGNVSTGYWLVQDPLFSGESGAHRLPAVATGGDRADSHLRACRLHQPRLAEELRPTTCGA